MSYGIVPLWPGAPPLPSLAGTERVLVLPLQLNGNPGSILASATTAQIASLGNGGVIAGGLPPDNPNLGQPWFNTTTGQLMVWNGSSWQLASTASVSPTAPANPTTGQFWWNPVSGLLTLWSGSAWVEPVVTISFGAAAPPNPQPGQPWYNPNTGLLELWNGTAWVLAAAPVTAFVKVDLAVFTASGTYTPSPGMQYVIVELIGAGGAGEPVTADGASWFVGRGGGAGAYIRFVMSAAQVGSSRNIVVCPGGMQGQYTDEQKKTFFGPNTWVHGGRDGNDTDGFGGYDGSFEGQPIGWSAPLLKTIGAPAVTYAAPPPGVFFHGGESGFAGLSFLNQAGPAYGGGPPVGQNGALIGRGGMGYYGKYPICNRVQNASSNGFDGDIGCGGSGSIAVPATGSGTVLVEGKGGPGAVVITEFCAAVLS